MRVSAGVDVDRWFYCDELRRARMHARMAYTNVGTCIRLYISACYCNEHVSSIDVVLTQVT